VTASATGRTSLRATYSRLAGSQGRRACVLIDSVQSQANRLEKALLTGLRSGRITLLATQSVKGEPRVAADQPVASAVVAGAPPGQLSNRKSRRGVLAHSPISGPCSGRIR
jgi:hypothetical protein